MLTVNFKPFPILSTERFTLRRLVREDAEVLFSMRSDENVMQYVSRPLAVTIEDAYELIRKIDTTVDQDEGINWAISFKDDPAKLIGTISLWRIEKENYRAEVGYMLHPAFHGKGVMLEAMHTVLKYGFENMKLHSVEAQINPENKASVRVVERANFVREAHFRENHFVKGKFVDTVIYSMLAPKAAAAI